MKIGQSSSEGSQGGTIYSINGLSPTIMAGSHGYANSYFAICIDDLFKNRQARIYKEITPSLRAERTGLKVAYGAALRGRYIDDDCNETKTKQQLELSNNEVSNAITTVQKDSLVAISSSKKI